MTFDDKLRNTELCSECGMLVRGDDYHPYAACLMFKGCHDSKTVQANLDAVQVRDDLRQQLAECQARNAEDGWRQCAKGQRTTQFCGQLEEAVKQAKREALLEAADKFAGSVAEYELRRMAKELE
jgi:hypothetical protein